MHRRFLDAWMIYSTDCLWVKVKVPATVRYCSWPNIRNSFLCRRPSPAHFIHKNSQVSHLCFWEVGWWSLECILGYLMFVLRSLLWNTQVIEGKGPAVSGIWFSWMFFFWMWRGTAKNSLVVLLVVDFRGFEASKPRCGRWSACWKLMQLVGRGTRGKVGRFLLGEEMHQGLLYIHRGKSSAFSPFRSNFDLLAYCFESTCPFVCKQRKKNKLLKHWLTIVSTQGDNSPIHQSTHKFWTGTSVWSKQRLFLDVADQEGPRFGSEGHMM